MKLNFYLLLGLLCLACFPSYSSNVEVYPANANDTPVNKDFTVKVLDDSQQWNELFSYDITVDAHRVHHSTMVNFGFAGSVKVAVISNFAKINSVKIRPLSLHIPSEVKGDTVFFTLNKPTDISIEINDDIFRNVHLLSNAFSRHQPIKTDPNVLIYSPGVYKIDSLVLKNNQQLYLAPGSVLMGKVVCRDIQNVKIYGGGMIYHSDEGIEILYSKNVSIDNLLIVNPKHYSVFGGQSKNIHINKVRSFSSRGWSDGIDLMSCSNVLIDSAFLRNSDDCIALYGHRWTYFGDAQNITVRNSTLWADVAHPIMMGTHGNAAPGKSEVIENVLFENIDILNHDEPQLDYQGCMAINVSDNILARNITFKDIRVEDFQQGQLVNLRVTYNKKYATAPGRGIENVLFKNVEYNGKNANISILEGYSPERSIKNISFEGLKINGQQLYTGMKKPGFMKVSDFARIYEGLYLEGISYKE